MSEILLFKENSVVRLFPVTRQVQFREIYSAFPLLQLGLGNHKTVQPRNFCLKLENGYHKISREIWKIVIKKLLSLKRIFHVRHNLEMCLYHYLCLKLFLRVSFIDNSNGFQSANSGGKSVSLLLEWESDSICWISKLSKSSVLIQL